jgi:hypothetical protein
MSPGHFGTELYFFNCLLDWVVMRAVVLSVGLLESLFIDLRMFQLIFGLNHMLHFLVI